MELTETYNKVIKICFNIAGPEIPVNEPSPFLVQKYLFSQLVLYGDVLFQISICYNF